MFHFLSNQQLNTSNLCAFSSVGGRFHSKFPLFKLFFYDNHYNIHSIFIFQQLLLFLLYIYSSKCVVKEHDSISYTNTTQFQKPRKKNEVYNNKIIITKDMHRNTIHTKSFKINLILV